MNILVLDCAVTRLSIAVKADDKIISEIYDIGMRQSEILVPVIQEVLSKVGIKPSELNYTALTIGPGSFTGLRLGISALKAIELAYNVPIYGISSLKTYAYPYSDFDIPVISCIDANKDKFYASITNGKDEILQDGDWEISKILESITNYNKIFVTGPDCLKLKKIIEDNNREIKVFAPKTRSLTTDSLISITEDLIKSGAEPLKDFDGPTYLRASEAELKLNSDSKK